MHEFVDSVFCNEENKNNKKSEIKEYTLRLAWAT